MILENKDCLEYFKEIEDDTIDLILVDPPYGTIKGIEKGKDKNNKNFRHSDTEWDNIIDIDLMFDNMSRVLKKNGVAVVFCQEPFTSKLITSYYSMLRFKYKMIWKKNNSGNAFNAKKSHLNYYEEILVFSKKHSFNSDVLARGYSRNLKRYIDTKEIKEDGMESKVSHFICSDALQFHIPTEDAYKYLVDKFNLSVVMREDFLTYEELKEIADKNKTTFNLLENEKSKSNVLEYKKPTLYVHPTQKPVELLIDLIKTFSNERDVVLDFAMGSGSTGVACKKTKRKFIGIEKEKKYFDIAVKRINEE